MSAGEEEPGFQVEDAISSLLRMGVTASVGLISAGTLVAFLEPGGYARTPAGLARLISRNDGSPHSAAGYFHALAHGDGEALIIAGLVLLILTPIARVGVSIWAFARAGNFAYVAITTTVFLLLLLSFALGRVG
jgi:uncharacterized membrane protein